MATTYVYPSTTQLREIEQLKLPSYMTQDPIFRYFSITNEDADNVSWEQKDNYYGLQQIRGLGGQPNRVQAVGAKRYVEVPGVYGEHMDIEEVEMTKRRRIGTLDQYVDINDLVMDRQDMLLQRRIDRIRQILWTLVTTGTFSVSLPNGGGVAHTSTYTFLAYDATTWATVATATPMLDFRAAMLLSRGYSVSFGRGATAIMNQKTLNNMLNNTNANDIGGKRVANGGNFLSLTQANQWQLDNSLPNIEVWDDGYFANSSDAGTPTQTQFVPDGKVIIFGARSNGARLGEYQMTRNANNPGLSPGPYTKVIRHDDEVPFKMEIHDGHNGGPAIWYPSAVLVMDVS